MNYVIQIQDGPTDKISTPFPVLDVSYASQHPDFTQAGEFPESLLSVIRGNIRIK